MAEGNLGLSGRGIGGGGSRGVLMHILALDVPVDLPLAIGVGNCLSCLNCVESDALVVILHEDAALGVAVVKSDFREPGRSGETGT